MLPRLMSWHCCLGLHHLSILKSYGAAALSEHDYDTMCFVIVHVQNISDSFAYSISGQTSLMLNVVFTRLMTTSCIPLRSMASSCRPFAGRFTASYDKPADSNTAADINMIQLEPLDNHIPSKMSRIYTIALLWNLRLFILFALYPCEKKRGSVIL